MQNERQNNLLNGRWDGIKISIGQILPNGDVSLLVVTNNQKYLIHITW